MSLLATVGVNGLNRCNSDHNSPPASTGVQRPPAFPRAAQVFNQPRCLASVPLSKLQEDVGCEVLLGNKHTGGCESITMAHVTTHNTLSRTHTHLCAPQKEAFTSGHVVSASANDYTHVVPDNRQQCMWSLGWV